MTCLPPSNGPDGSESRISVGMARPLLEARVGKPCNIASKDRAGGNPEYGSECENVPNDVHFILFFEFRKRIDLTIKNIK